MNDKRHNVYICSDSVGETAEAVAKATIRQFDYLRFHMKRVSHVKHEDEITQLLEEVAVKGGIVAYTLVQPDLREMMKKESIRLGVRVVDIMGPMLQAFMDEFNGSPNRKPGVLHELDDNYFRRMEAVEFTVRSDDGRDTKSLLEADLVLIGVSRTSKTPLSIFLAHKGIKTANLPLVPEVKVPQELFQIQKERIIGLTMTPEKMLKIRSARLQSEGISSDTTYNDLNRIKQEIDYVHSIMKKLGCPVIDVTDRAIEETAGIIIQILQENGCYS